MSRNLTGKVPTNKIRFNSYIKLFIIFFILSFYFQIASPVSANINRWVAVGQGTNTIAYSDNDGLSWSGLGTSIFSTNGYSVAWNGTLFVAVGKGTNTIAYSADGITWTGLGTSIFSDQGYGIAWNGTRFVAVGLGTNTIAYSSDGISWTGLGSSVFSTYGYGISWNGTRFVASGNGTNGLAYSSDGISWTGLGSTIVSDGRSVAWNGTKFVIVANGTNTIAYSSDGVTWTGLGNTIFSTYGYGISWNGTRFVAVGKGTNTIAYSSDGVTWTGLGNILFLDGRSVAWNGTHFVAVGTAGTDTIAYSSDGISWTGLGKSIFSTYGFGITSAPSPNLIPAQPSLNINTIPVQITNLSVSSSDAPVQLGWTIPSDGGSQITDYLVQYRIYSSSNWITFNHTASINNTITINGLTNGTRYEFNVMAVNAYGTALASNLVNTIPMSVLFQDNFENLTLGNINGQNGWTTGGDGTWNVASGDGGQMLSGSTGTNYNTHYVANGSSQYADQKVKVDFQAVNVNSVPQVWLRRSSATGDGNGYFLDHTNSPDKWYISINNGADRSGYSVPASIAGNPTLITGNWYTVEFQVINDVSSSHPIISLYLYPQGGTKPALPLLTYTDTLNLFQTGYVGLGTNTSAINFDNLVVYGTSADAIKITSPSRGISSLPQVATISITDESNIPFYIPYIQTSTTLTTTATIGSSILPSGGGVKFVLNEGLSSEQVQYDLISPFSVNFTGLPKGTYTLDTYVVNSSQVTQTGTGTHDTAINIGIGDIITAIGDSITMGYNGNSYGTTAISNWLNAPAGSASLDNRNYPQYSPQDYVYRKSFLTELNDKLSAYYGYPVFIMNEGWGGYKTSDYVTLMATTQWTNRQNLLHPNKWFIDLGVNDAGASISTSTLQTNLQTIITNLINNYGATSQNIFLSRPNYAIGSSYATFLPTYLPIVDGLITSDGLSSGADFYTYFLNHHATYFVDIVHPNVAGFTQIARLNYISVIQPQNVSISQNLGTITLTWNNLSSSESTIVGYNVKYGTTSGTYSTTVDVGNVTSKTITGLVDGQTYYFAVSAYDNDATLVNQTQNSSEISIAYENSDTTPPSTPTSTPSVGTYNSTQSVTLSATGSDYVKYSLTETPVTCSVGTLYSGATPISIASSQTIYVRACDNAGNSSTQSFAYVIDSEAPSTSIATPSADTYTGTQSVSLTSAGSDSIRYSTTETPADCSSGTLYENPIQVSVSQTIYVRACDSLNNSSTTSFAYVISPIHHTSSGSSVFTQFNNLIEMGNLQVAEELKKEFPNQLSNNQIPLTPSTQTTSIVPTTPSTPIIINRILKLTTPRMWGDDIKALQTFLNTKGYDSGTPDGNFGPKTQSAVIAFQKANGLTTDGSVGPNTLKYLNGNQTITTTASTNQPTVTRILKLSVPRMIGDDVLALQTYLSTNGYDVGALDGVLGNKTKSAIIAFQTANGLTPDGIFGSMSRQKANLAE